MSERPITTQEVAVMFGVSPDTVKRWAGQGKLPHFVTPGGHRRFLRTEIEAVIAASKPQGEAVA